MATTCTRDWLSLEADFRRKGEHSLSDSYKVKFDTTQTDLHAVLIAAQSAGPNPVPLLGTYIIGLSVLVESIKVSPNDESRRLWHIVVTYVRPEPGDDEGQQIENPLLRPPVPNLEYIEQQYVIKKAKNVEPLPHGKGDGTSRPANTEGPIVNAAGKRDELGQIATERVAVWIIEKNFAQLSEIYAENKTYKRTTNSDTPEGFDVRTLEYLGTRSLGRREENGYVYWPGVRQIGIEDSTDRTIDNVGFTYWSVASNTWERAKVKDPDTQEMIPSPEPVNLKLDGSQGGDNTTTITYRHLEPIPYAPLVT